MCAAVAGCSPPGVPSADDSGSATADRAADAVAWGEVELQADTVEAPAVSASDEAALLGLIQSHHRAWLAQDTAALLDLMSIDAVRVHGRSGLAQGAEQISAALATQWEPYERPGGTVAQAFSIRDVDLSVRGDAALASYWIDVRGGARWEFEERRLGLDVYRRTPAGWELVLHSNTTATDAVDRASEPERPQMEFVYPARDLERAIAFYEPLLGGPRSESVGRASYDLGGARFHLDTAPVGGVAEAAEGYPNGIAEFVVENLEGEVARLRSAGIRVRASMVSGGDPASVFSDPDGNTLVFRQRAQAEEFSASPVVTLVSEPTDSIADAIGTHWRALVTTDVESTVQGLSARGRWVFETTRSPTVAYDGIEQIRQGLPSVWSDFDRGSGGLAVQVALAPLRIQRLGELASASYEYEIASLGSGSHRRKGVAAHVLERGSNGWTIVASVVLTLPDLDRAVLSLDYTGYPVTRLRRAERFYTQTLGFGVPYQDVSYRGWWTRDSVFGIYRVGEWSPELLREARMATKRHKAEQIVRKLREQRVEEANSMWKTVRSLRGRLRASFVIADSIGNRRPTPESPSWEDRSAPKSALSASLAASGCHLARL